MPLGSAASLIIHGGILLAAFMTWQATPRIMPEDVIAVDMVSDIPSVKGENTEAETAQTGVDTPTPSPLPQTLPPSQSEPLPSPIAQPPPLQNAQAAEAAQAAAPAAPAAPPPPPPPPPPPTKLAPAPAPRPAPKPVPSPLPNPARQPVAKVAPQQIQSKVAPPAKVGQRRESPTAPIEFDLAAASSAATGADSGGRRAPQLASRGQAGRLGKAGGGAQLTGDLEAALRSQIQPCWLEPANMADASRLLVVVSIDLGVDGSLLRDPVLVTPSSRAGASPSLVVAIDNALRAVRQCAPFNLPPDRYDSWRQVRFNFDPQRMARR
jgi:outer membrane biosynthesis protein TonB